MQQFNAELIRLWKEFLRYPSEALVAIVILVAVFYGLFLGTQFMAGPDFQFGQRLDQIIIGYIVWTMIINGQGSIAQEMQREAQVGALEQLFLSASGPIRLFTLRAIADTVLNLIVTAVILFTIMGLTGRWLHLDVRLVPPLIFLMIGQFGIAFILGAIALRTKQVTQLLGATPFLLLFIIMTPFEEWQNQWGILGSLLPLSPSVALMREVVTQNMHIDHTLWLHAALNSLFYCLLGLLLFSRSLRVVKRTGSLAWY